MCRWTRRWGEASCPAPVNDFVVPSAARRSRSLVGLLVMTILILHLPLVRQSGTTNADLRELGPAEIARRPRSIAIYRAALDETDSTISSVTLLLPTHRLSADSCRSRLSQSAGRTPPPIRRDSIAVRERTIPQGRHAHRSAFAKLSLARRERWGQFLAQRILPVNPAWRSALPRFFVIANRRRPSASSAHRRRSPDTAAGSSTSSCGANRAVLRHE